MVDGMKVVSWEMQIYSESRLLSLLRRQEPSVFGVLQAAGFLPAQERRIIEGSIINDKHNNEARHSRERGNPWERWSTWIPAFAGMTNSDLSAVVSCGNPNKRHKTGAKSLVNAVHSHSTKRHKTGAKSLVNAVHSHSTKRHKTGAKSLVNAGARSYMSAVFSVVKIIFAFSIAPAAAQSLPDPTRPPQFVAPTATAAEALSPQLHSVLVPVHGKPVAMIGGVAVSVGDKVGDAKVTRISETEVVLRGPEGEQVLRMTPGVDKQTIATPQVAPRSAKKWKARKSAQQKPSDDPQEQRKEKGTP